MSPTAPPPKPRLPLPIIGLMVVVTGFFLPQLVLTPNRSPAPTPDTATTASNNTRPVDAPDFSRLVTVMLVGTAVLIGGCVVAVRWSQRTPPAPTRGDSGIVASTSLGLAGTVHLVEMNDRRLLLGVDSSGIRTIVELPGRGPRTDDVVGPLRVTVPTGVPA
jgi:flagellar biogenesis protein FliO